MNLAGIELSILWPALIMGILVSATHVPLGMQVLKRGIVFIDLAIAQIAGMGVIAADTFGFGDSAITVQSAALITAFLGALLLTWTERRFADAQEAIIGVSFILAASAEVILLASNPHGAEHMKDMLVGQILWVNPATLLGDGLVSALILALWFGLGEKLGRVGFYLLFALAVTMSVQRVGLYLVFATLIVPALATRAFGKGRLWRAYALALAGYALGLAASSAFDWPSGPVIVWAVALLGMGLYALGARRLPT
jgi:zinc/manganese transport system permease protein